MQKTSFFSFFLLLAMGLSSGCISEPDFPNEPAISFLSVRNRAFTNQDSVYITIRFEDGDGDLGLNATDNTGKFAPTITDPNGQQVPNKFHNNYFITVLRQENGVFNPIVFPGGASFSGRFPRLKQNDIASALEGELTYAIQLFVGALGSPIRRGDILAFEIQIADRALNLSNTVRTETIVAGTSSN